MSFCGFCFVLLHSRPTVQLSWNALVLSNKERHLYHYCLGIYKVWST